MPRTRGHKSQEYDWNKPATFFQVLPDCDHPDMDELTTRGRVLQLPPGVTSLSSIQSDIETLVSQYDMTHGDVVCLDTHRFSNAHFLCRNDDGSAFSWVANKDDSGAGYLTVPKQISAQVTDLMGKYKDIVSGPLSLGSINFHLSNNDKFITDKLGTDIPAKVMFDVHYLQGAHEETLASVDGKEWKSCELENTTIDDIMSLFNIQETTNADCSKFQVELTLTGDDLEAYKVKYSTSKGGKYSWIMASPKFPKGWSKEDGEKRIASAEVFFVWKCSGPKHLESEAKAKIESFLEGFSYNFK